MCATHINMNVLLLEVYFRGDFLILLRVFSVNHEDDIKFRCGNLNKIEIKKPQNAK